MDRRDRIRFLVAEREATPWREELARALSGFPIPVVLETPPGAEPRTTEILAAWERVMRAAPDRRTFTAVASAAEHVSAAAGAPGDELWVLPGPTPHVGVLSLTAPLAPDLAAVLATWNGEGFLILAPSRGDVLLVDLLQEDPPIVEVQSGRVPGWSPMAAHQRTPGA